VEVGLTYFGARYYAPQLGRWVSADAVFDQLPADATHVKLRAERKGNGDGRVYTINFETFDSAGNPTAGTCSVDVMKGNHVAIDSGPAQTVCL